MTSAFGRASPRSLDLTRTLMSAGGVGRATRIRERMLPNTRLKLALRQPRPFVACFAIMAALWFVSPTSLRGQRFADAQTIRHELSQPVLAEPEAVSRSPRLVRQSPTDTRRTYWLEGGGWWAS